LKRYRFAGVGIALESDPEVPGFGVPRGWLAESPGEGPPDIHLRLETRPLEIEIPDGPARLKRGGLEARGDSRRMIWSHPDLGAIIDAHPQGGEVQVGLPQWAWERVTSVVDQLLIPALLPPLAARGVRAIHAASVLVGGSAALIGGSSGSGKTTAALLLLAGGASLIADDLSFLYRDGDRVVVCSLGDGPRAHEDVWLRFPQFHPRQALPGEKRQLPPDAFPWSASGTVRRVFLLGEKPEAGLRTQALLNLLSLSYHVGDEENVLRSLLALLEHVPVRWVSGPEEAATLALRDTVDGPMR